ncbi:unnamed protein product [Spodoptera exigua]|nr:unnamed protein product [Spodoptera exigua]
MSNAICQSLRSPIKRLANLRRAYPISTSLVHNETILVKNNDEFVNKIFYGYCHSILAEELSILGTVVQTRSPFQILPQRSSVSRGCEVMNSDKPVIVNFHADWCEPCKILTPKLKELIEPLNNLDLAVVDVEDNADLVHTFEVKAVPAVIAIKNGIIVDKFIGLVDADMITGLIDRMAGKKKESA